MACLLVPLAEGVVVSAVKKLAFSKKDSSNKTVKVAKEKILVLEKMLYGGSFLLAIEHIYHGEISFVPPFFTAMKSSEGISFMLQELKTKGFAMAVLITAVWLVGITVSYFANKKSLHKKSFICA